MRRKRLVGALAGVALGLALVAIVIAVRQDLITNWWIRFRLERNPQFLLTVIEEDGDNWDLARLEEVMGRNRAHGLVADLWFRLLEQDHSGVLRHVLQDLKDSAPLGKGDVATIIVWFKEDSLFYQWYAPTLNGAHSVFEFKNENLQDWARLQAWLYRTARSSSGGQVAIDFGQVERAPVAGFSSFRALFGMIEDDDKEGVTLEMTGSR